MTFEESGKTIMPYTSLSSNFKKCKEHEWEIKKDFMGHIWSECKTCGSSK